MIKNYAIPMLLVIPLIFFASHGIRSILEEYQLFGDGLARNIVVTLVLILAGISQLFGFTMIIKSNLTFKLREYLEEYDKVIDDIKSL